MIAILALYNRLQHNLQTGVTTYSTPYKVCLKQTPADVFGASWTVENVLVLTKVTRTNTSSTQYGSQPNGPPDPPRSLLCVQLDRTTRTLLRLLAIFVVRAAVLLGLSSGPVMLSPGPPRPCSLARVMEGVEGLELSGSRAPNVREGDFVFHDVGTD